MTIENQTHEVISSSQTYLFSDEDFERIAEKVHREFGLYLTHSKKDLVYSRLSKRLRVLGIRDFKKYIKVIEADESERRNLLSALTTNVTQFFREEHHFTMLKESAFPELIDRARNGGRVRIWSAGCSAGQEPYSLAFSLLELFPGVAKYDIKILATDIDPLVLAQAKLGIYNSEEVKSVPTKICERFFDTVDSRGLRVNDSVRGLITFGELNLVEDWPFSGGFDVIICRNVAIYFDKETQSRLWARFVRLLPIGGWLFVGHSERVTGPALPQLQSCGVTSYRKSRNVDATEDIHTKSGLRYEP